MKGSLKAVLYAVIFTFGAVSVANAALLSRLGGLAYYDTELDITWAADANINGRDTWDNQQAWVSGLTIGGIGGWRLPNMDVNGDDTIVDCSGGGVAGCSDNEMGFLYHEEGITASSPGVFTNVQSSFYWSGTEFAPAPGRTWIFLFGNGHQGATGKDSDLFAWAVHSGDVGASVVPVPGTIALMGLGLLGLLGFGRRQRRL